jgi:hypothetical protein
MGMPEVDPGQQWEIYEVDTFNDEVIRVSDLQGKPIAEAINVLLNEGFELLHSDNSETHGLVMSTSNGKYIFKRPFVAGRSRKELDNQELDRILAEAQKKNGWVVYFVALVGLFILGLVISLIVTLFNS